MGKKAKKAGKGKEKTERKTAKAAEKRARRDNRNLDEEDDIDAILEKIKKEEAKKVAVYIEENVAPPSPRCNCTLTVNPLKETELVLFGGEYYNGDKTFVYGHLYRYNTEKHEWKQVSSPNSPPPRSAHQAVAWKNSLFIFGGEFTSPNQERFHHYKDLWKLDLITNAWEQLALKGCPSPRSGHRMVLYKHKIVLFGGFYDNLREVRYFNDLHVFDLDNYQWMEIKPKPGALWPSSRSGFQLFVYQDEIFMYGGYFKDYAADKDGSEKGIVHADMWSLDPRSWEWNKVKKLGYPPGPRAGFSMCIHKKRAILFGGVVDSDEQGDLLHSTFLKELYAFQMDNRRWYPLELRKAKTPKVKAQKPARAELQEAKKEDGDDDDENGALELVDVLEEVSLDNERNGTTKEDSQVNASSVVALSQVLRPCGRINACMTVGRDTLFLYGGLMEIGDREIALDDLFTLDLNKLDEWQCIFEASKTEWLEPSDEDDDEADDEEGSETESDDEEDEDMEDVEEGSSSLLSTAQEAVAVLRGEGKKMLRKERKAKIDRLRSELGLADLQRTPKPGETLKDFFSRTNMYWQMAAYEHTQHTGKELRKDGFDLASGRYQELKPVLDELVKLEAEQKEEEEEEARKTVSKKGKEKARPSDNRR